MGCIERYDPIVIESLWISAIGTKVPELPPAYQKAFAYIVNNINDSLNKMK
jgi:hypothetical protein